LTLHEHVDEYSHVCDQILGSLIIPNFTSTCSTLLHVPCKPLNDPSVFADDSSTFTSQHDNSNHSLQPGKGHHKCDHCGKLGHKIERCYALHGRSLRSVVVVQTDPPSHLVAVDPPSYAPTDKSALFSDFLKWCEDRKPSSFTGYVACTSISFLGLTQSSSIGPWVLIQEPILHSWKQICFFL